MNKRKTRAAARLIPVALDMSDPEIRLMVEQEGGEVYWCRKHQCRNTPNHPECACRPMPQQSNQRIHAERRATREKIEARCRRKRRARRRDLARKRGAREKRAMNAMSN